MVMLLLVLLVLVLALLLMLLLLLILMFGHLVELHGGQMCRNLRVHRSNRHIPVWLRPLLHVRELLHLVHLRHWWRMLLQILDRETVPKRRMLLLLLKLLLILWRLNCYVLLLLLLCLLHRTW